MSQTNSAEGKKAMQNLQGAWYNALCSSLNLNADEFQLVQASKPLEYTSDTLERIFDAVPPKSVAHDFNPSQRNSFFDQYRNVVNAIKIQGEAGDQFRQVMGDHFADWQKYKKNNEDQIMNLGIETAFKRWADINLPASAGRKAKSVFVQMHEHTGTIGRAKRKIEKYSPDDDVPAYNHGDADLSTIKALRNALNHGKQETISFDSSKASSSVDHTWAEGEVGGIYDFFEGAAGVETDTLTKKAASQDVTVEATFDHVISFTAKPSREWYSSAALSNAYQTKSNKLWPAGGTVTWDNTFGEGGSLRRGVSSIIVYDGIDMTVTSHASYSKDEQKDINDAGEIGFWPFFEASAAHHNHQHTHFEDDGAMKVTTKLPTGNPNILGVNVNEMSDVLGGK